MIKKTPATNPDAEMHPLKADILGRVETRLKQLGLRPATASKAAGAGPDLIRDWYRDRKVMPRVDSLRDLASVLQTTPEWLAFGRGSEDLNISIPHVSGIPLISWVAASEFADTGDARTPQNAPIIFQADLTPGSYIGLTVRGDSMDRIAPDGATIIVDLNDKDPQPRGLYIFRNQNEATFKRYMIDPIRLEPFSTNPKHETIYPNGEIFVIGRVKRIFNEL